MESLFGQKNESKILDRALQLSPQMTFPHRKETASILDYFIKKNDHWKLKYYLGLYQWNIGNDAYAKLLFNQCGETPNEIHFYLAKIKLENFDPLTTQKSLERAQQIDSDHWRIQLAWMQHYYRTSQYLLAKELGAKSLKKHSKKAPIELLYAKALLKLNQFESCVHFLENIQILPFEGASEGRELYHEGYVRLALKQYKNSNYSKAISSIKKAFLWPKNLGTGKHFDTDERLENYLLALFYEKSGAIEKAKNRYSKILNHKTPEYLNENSKLALQLKVAKKMKNKELIAHLKKQYHPIVHTNIYVKWAFAHFGKTKNKDEIKNKILSLKIKIQAYDTLFIDSSFRLVYSVIKTLEKK